MPNPEFYQILGMFKDDQIINVHVKMQGMELQFRKSCSAFYREFKTTTKGIRQGYGYLRYECCPNVTEHYQYGDLVRK